MSAPAAATGRDFHKLARLASEGAIGQLGPAKPAFSTSGILDQFRTRNLFLRGGIQPDVRRSSFIAAQQAYSLQHLAIARIAANAVVNRAGGQVAYQDLARAGCVLQPQK